jgi:tape measure domain-containing protein
MSSVDNRIVKMEFDNATFKKEALATKASLDQVDAAVAKAGNGKGLLSLSSNMQQVGVHASKMAIVTTTALATIANKVTNVALNMVKSLTFDPLKQGFLEYESLLTKQNTIMNATGKSAKEVTRILGELNEYSDKTIYSFGNMTDAIQKFVNAGVPLEQSVASIKGIANAAAFAGASSEEANRAMYAFSQSMSLGFVGLQDWNQIENANMGTIQFKNTLLEAAAAAGTLTKQGDGYVTASGVFVSATKGWRDGLQEQWATTEVLNGALAKYSDKTTELGKKAFEAAQEVRTFTAFMDTLKESIGSGWSQIFKALFGDLDQATKLWTGLSESIGGVVGRFFDFTSGALTAWRNARGFQATIKTISHVIAPFAAIFGAVADAIGKAFPAKSSGSGLAKFSKALEQITRPLNILAKLIRGELTPIQALLRMFQWGGNIVEKLAGFIGKLVNPLLDLAGIKLPTDGGFFGFLRDLAGEVKSAIKQVDALIQKGESLKDALGSVDINMPKLPTLPDMAGLSLPNVGALPGLSGSGLSSIFSGFNASKATSDLDQVNGSLVGLSDEIESTTTVGDKVIPALQAVWDGLRKFFKGFNVEDLMAAFNLAVLSTFLIQIGGFFNSLSKTMSAFADAGGGISGVLDKAGDALGSFQTAARAKLITAIAIAIGILAVSLWLLSRIPADKMVTGLAGLAGIMLIMKVGVNSIADAVEKMDGKGTTFKLTALSLALVALGLAILLLATAFLILNKVDWSSMLKGIITILVVMKTLEALAKVGEHGAKNLLGAAVAITAVAFSMVILAGALLLFGLVRWEDMAKAGVVLLAITLAIGALALIPYGGIEKVGLAMLAVSAAMLGLAVALIMFAAVKWESIAKAGVVLTLLALALAAILFFGGGPAGAAGILAIAGAMVMLALAGLMLNDVDWSSIGKIALILGVLVLGFAAFLAVITFFAPALILLSGFAGAIALLALALTGLMLAFAIILPLMAISAGAFAAFATGAAIAIGVFLTSLALQAPIMKKSILSIMQTVIDTIVEAVPMVIDGFKRLFAAIKNEFSGGGEGGGKMQASMGKSSEGWITKLADGIKKKIPLIVDKAIDLMVRFLSALSERAKELGAKGAELVANLINGVASRIDRIVEAATNLIIKFAEGISNGLSRIIEAGVQLIADFLHRLADTIRSGSAAIGGGINDVVDAMKQVGRDIVNGLIAGVNEMFGDAMGVIGNLASGMVDKAKGILDIFSPSRVFKNIGKFLVEGLTLGIQNNAAAAITAVASMVSGQIAVASAYMSDFVQKLDQQAIAATGKAVGLQRAAEKAAKAAEKQAQAADKAEAKADKTKKNKKDDKAANRQQRRADKAAEAAEKLGNRANRADRLATKAEEKAAAAAERVEREKQFAEADTFDKAKMRSEDAQAAMDAAKLAETRATASLAEAAALEKQAKADGVTKKQRKELLKQAEQLRKEAKAQAEAANAQIAAAQTAAGDALALQKQAGDEAAAAFQKQFEDEAAQDAAEDAFEKLTAEEKAAERRRQAAALQAEANKDLLDAKALAYTDLEAANELAAEAMEQAEQARNYLEEAMRFDEEAKRIAAEKADAAAQGTGQANTETGSRVVNLDPTEAASIAFNRYNDVYSDAAAAAAAGQTVEFNQYNTSPEALSPAELYRQSNNLLSFAASKLQPTA